MLKAKVIQSKKWRPNMKHELKLLIQFTMNQIKSLVFYYDCFGRSRSPWIDGGISCGSVLFAAATKELEQIQEDVADVKVELESCVQVVFGTEGVFLVSNEHLGVNSQEESHDESTESTVNCLHGRVVTPANTSANAKAHQSKQQADAD